jgi:uncharacterized protein (DUF58 family)
VVGPEELERAVRLLRVRGRREATGLLSGSSVSRFRGSGIEFEESRPYVPGDDVSSLDWSATARTGQLHVKRHREERSQTLLFALDTSPSLAFHTVGTSKSALAARAVALLTAAAGRTGDRTALVAFDGGVRERIAPGRGGAHALRVLRAAVRHAPEAGAAPRGASDLAVAARALQGLTRRRGVVLLFSDFRVALGAEQRAALGELARRHELVAVVLVDPAERELPRVGALRIADPASGATRLLDTASPATRARYREAAERRRRELASELRRAGTETLWLRTDASPLQPLAHFLAERAARRAR